MPPLACARASVDGSRACAAANVKIVMASIPKIASAIDKFSFLKDEPPSRPRRAASSNTNCAGASMNTAPKPKAL